MSNIVSLLSPPPRYGPIKRSIEICREITIPCLMDRMWGIINLDDDGAVVSSCRRHSMWNPVELGICL